MAESAIGYFNALALERQVAQGSEHVVPDKDAWVRPFWERPGKRAHARAVSLLGTGRQRLKSDPSTNAYLGIVERAG
jgi:hypothetical protein